MSAKLVLRRVEYNSATMANTLPSSESVKRRDKCCGIHGAARERKGIKDGTSSARRRYDKRIILLSLEEIYD